MISSLKNKDQNRKKMNIQEEVEVKVARLLSMVCNDKTDPETYKFVFAKLTRMAISGTLPANCRQQK